jgi:hypothetical protein
MTLIRKNRTYHGGTEKKQEKPLKHGGMEVTEKAFAADLR